MTHLTTPRHPTFDAFKVRWRKLISNIRDPYRPELHYMRGLAQSGAPSINHLFTGSHVEIGDRNRLNMASDQIATAEPALRKRLVRAVTP